MKTYYLKNDRTSRFCEEYDMDVLYSMIEEPKTIVFPFPNTYNYFLNDREHYYDIQLPNILKDEIESKFYFESRDYKLFNLLAGVRYYKEFEYEGPSIHLNRDLYQWEFDVSYPLRNLYDIILFNIDYHSHVTYYDYDLLDKNFIKECEDSNCGQCFLDGVKTIKRVLVDNNDKYTGLRFNICFDN